MKRYVVFYLIIILVMFTGCANYEDDFASIENRLDELGTYKTNLEDVNKRLDEIDLKITEITEKVDTIDSEYLKLNSQYNSLDIEKVNESINSVQKDVRFIEEMIWRDNLFERDEVSIGDRVGMMEIIDITNYKGPVFYFKGDVKVKGYFEYITDSPMLPDGIAFYVEDTTSYLPRERNDYRILWFMFDNVDEATEMLLEYNEGSEIEIIVSDYIVNLVASSVYNSAMLVEIVTEK